MFVHIPKAAGSSIEIALDMYGFCNSGSNTILDSSKAFGKTYQHMTASELSRFAQKQGVDLQKFEKFTIVRHPAERMLSEYKWRKGWDEKARSMSFIDFLTLHLSDIKPRNMNFDNRHFVAQSDFITDEIRVFRLEVEMDKVSSIIRRYSANNKIEKHNVTNEVNSEFWNDNTRALDLIFEVYKSDFSNFDYGKMPGEYL